LAASFTQHIELCGYASKGFVDGLIEQISIIRKEHFSVAWENYVHQKFRGTFVQKKRPQRGGHTEAAALGVCVVPVAAPGTT
jgi:hypothetical protein